MEASAPRAFVVVQDARVREALESALHATGYAIVSGYPDHLDVPPDRALLAIGTDSLSDEDAALLAQGGGSRPKLMLVSERADRSRAIGAFITARADHLVDALAPALVVTLTKLSQGDYFGLPKYLQAGAAVTQFMVATSEERRHVLDEVSTLAARERCHPRLVQLLGAALDEMIINALYRPDPAVLVGARATRPAAVEFGCDGRFLGVAVRDTYGRFAHGDLFEALERAREHARAGMSATTAHASLGMRTMLDGLAQLAIDTEPGVATEVIGLVDLHRSFKMSRTAVPGIGWFETERRGGGAVEPTA